MPAIQPELQHLTMDEYNDTCIQSLHSSCGAYRCIVGVLLAKGKSLKSIVTQFCNNLATNDLKAIKLLEPMFTTEACVVSFSENRHTYRVG